MAEVVVGLESVLALQEKTHNTLHPASMTRFGRMLPFLSNGENSVGDGSLQSLGLYFDTVGGEDRILCRFDFETISIATENFSEANKVLRCHFGFMYKGRLHNGQGIAIAQPYSDIKFQRYINEVSLLVKLEHENLSQLLGYCIEGTRAFLVYEFAPYACLDDMILEPVKRTLLDWNKRYKIILGVARVLVYLHKDAPIRIIRGDVHLRNILLDESLDPKLSSFWSARCLAINETDHIDVNAIRGTYGYMAPEYAMHGRLSTKADVFSFGVLVLETISGIRKYDFILRSNEHFLQYAWRNWWEGTWSNIVDPKIDADSSSIRTFIHIALLCVQADATDRPTMEDVVGMLCSTSFLSLPVPKSPITKEDSNYRNAPEVLFQRLRFWGS